MIEEDAVYKTNVEYSREMISDGCYVLGKAYLHGQESNGFEIEPDIWFALQCFRHAGLLGNKRAINRYVPLYVRYCYAHMFNKPEDYLPTGPLVKPEYQKIYENLCNAELAKFESCPSEKDTSE